MTDEATEAVSSLHRSLEEAVRHGRARSFLLPQLERLGSLAVEGSAPWCFAHRVLAELLLEQAPWRAALSARRVAQAVPDDDAAHALLGLALALQGNFRAAAACYRRALRASPGNPWYSHNLGHLLDVALDEPREAITHLRRANECEPDQDEVRASLAHCLARLGVLDEASTIARDVATRHPSNADHQRLAEWIEAGARDDRDPASPALLASTLESAHGDNNRFPAASEEEPSVRAREADDREIAALFARAFERDEERVRAQQLWAKYEAAARPVHARAEVLAAAIEYAIARLDGASVRQRDVAARYGISVSALQQRHAAMRQVLRLGVASRTPRN